MILRQNYQLDLLRKRREFSNSDRVDFSKVKKQKKLGLLFGVLISCLGISICAWTGFQTYKRIKIKEKLIIEANEYKIMKRKYESMIKKLNSIYSVNNQISQGIIGTKSGSALLLEIRDKLPTTIQLIKINTNGPDLILQGRANQPSALSSINSFKIQLSNSFLIDNRSVFLSEAWQSKTDKISHLNFTLSSRFSSATADEISSNYKRLGSLGLLKRVNLLEQEGLIK